MYKESGEPSQSLMWTWLEYVKVQTENKWSSGLSLGLWRCEAAMLQNAIQQMTLRFVVRIKASEAVDSQRPNVGTFTMLGFIFYFPGPSLLSNYK